MKQPTPTKAIYLMACSIALYSTHSMASTDMPIQPPPPVFFDTADIAQWHTLQNTQELPSHDNKIATTPPIDSQTLTQQETLIEQALINEDWQSLSSLLGAYQTMPAFDEILVAYASGAMDRKQGRQAQAIQKYRQILQKDPSLLYVKLDLALMLTENKAFADAVHLFDEIQKDDRASDKVLAIINSIRRDIEHSQKISPSVEFNYESTDNVNNASSDRSIRWLGREWQKDENSLPQSAHGIRYGAGLDKQHNLTGNHYGIGSINGSGVHYWDNPSYNEQSIRTEIGYKYWDIHKHFSLVPFSEQNWLGNNKYSSYVGLSARYGQNIDSANYLQASTSWGQKHYADPKTANRYDSDMLTLSTTISHRLDNGSLLYGGLDGTLEKTQDPSLASTRIGWRGGIIHSFGNLTINANARYAHRQFHAPHTYVYNFIRKDNEYQAGLSFWHHNISWQGIRPKVNIRYQKINSNMPAFYSRGGSSYFVSLEKAF